MTGCQTAVDKPSLRRTNFHSCCHGSSIFGCLEDTVFRRIQLHAGMTAWEDKSHSSLSLLFPQPSMPPLCLGNKQRGNFWKAACEALESASVAWTWKQRQYLLPTLLWNPNICRCNPFHKLNHLCLLIYLYNPCVYLCKWLGKTNTGHCSCFRKNAFQVHIWWQFNDSLHQ